MSMSCVLRLPSRQMAFFLVSVNLHCLHLLISSLKFQSNGEHPCKASFIKGYLKPQLHTPDIFHPMSLFIQFRHIKHIASSRDLSR